MPQLPKPRSSISPKLGRTKESSAILDLLGLGTFFIFYAYNLWDIKHLVHTNVITDAPATNQINVNGSGDDVFSSFLSAPPASAATTGNDISNGSKAAATISKTEEESFFDQTMPLSQEKSKMTKDSILALYGTPSHQSSVYGVPGNAHVTEILLISKTNILKIICTLYFYLHIFQEECILNILYHINSKMWVHLDNKALWVKLVNFLHKSRLQIRYLSIKIKL